MRRAPSLDAVIPALYLRGISTNNFQEALEAIMGKDAKGLSATNITRLKQSWEQEYDLMDHPIKEIDSEGNVTTKVFNVFGKPLEIHYPDGTLKPFPMTAAAI